MRPVRQDAAADLNEKPRAADKKGLAQRQNRLQ